LATIRSLIDHITLLPGSKRGEIAATLHGDLATILAWTAQTNIAGAAAPAMSVSVVAGAGFGLCDIFNAKGLEASFFAPQRKPNANSRPSHG